LFQKKHEKTSKQNGKVFQTPTEPKEAL